MNRSRLTIVESFGGRHQTRCGYCKHISQRYSHGMWAHCMTPTDYQDLIDRGWRRSGQYCYKPNNPLTCCPCYTIKCDANKFHLSKSHKKILKKLNNFLRTGQKGGGASSSSITNDDDNATAETMEHTDCDIKMDGEEQQRTEADESSALTETKMITSNQPKVAIDIDNVLKVIENADKSSSNNSSSSTGNTEAGNVIPSGMASCEHSDTMASNSICNKSNNEAHKRGAVAGPDPTKPLQPKAKVLRQQRKAEKLLAKTNAINTPTTNENECNEIDAARKLSKNEEKTFKSFIDGLPADGKHKLKVKLVASHAASTEAELTLYRRYQVGVHKDPPEKITRKSFENFLVRSPIQLNLVNVESDEFERSKNTAFELYTKYQTKVHHDPPSDLSEFVDFLCNSPIKHESPENGPSSGYGSFHQQYWLDDTLIAVGVIDILPKCVSSVYFFYDPDYSFLTLGTYGTLREIEFTQDLNSTCQELTEYYMGFYIHSCPKMRYKGKLQPSYLLCPEIYTWHLLDDDLLKLLDQSKYSRFNLDPMARDLNEFNPATDLNHLRLLVDYKYCLTYKDFKEYKCTTDGTDSDDEEVENFTEYGKLVGKVLSRRLYLVT